MFSSYVVALVMRKRREERRDSGRLQKEWWRAQKYRQFLATMRRCQNSYFFHPAEGLIFSMPLTTL
jgi:hypothetical protein